MASRKSPIPGENRFPRSRVMLDSGVKSLDGSGYNSYKEIIIRTS
jgi:hypothetical protein